ncbi:YgaP-like transmembrane domain [Paenibacillus alginolyticus]
MGRTGIPPIITGATRYCPLNELLNISNCELEAK